MTKSNANNKPKMTKPKVKSQHLFKSVRDPVVLTATSSTPTMLPLTTNSSGGLSISTPIAPFGVTGTALTAPSGGGTVTYSGVTVANPLHPWLFNQARNFERFRVTRYVLVFVGALGANTTGQIMLDSDTDFADTTTTQSLALSTGGKVFDLSSAGSKELRFNCDVDSSWKKVSGAPFVTVSSLNAILPSSSVNDLLITNWFVTVTGAPASTSIGSLFAEYDIEFRDPVSYGANV